MILSHRHRFIFIKTTKTAGTSIELALSNLCGPNDIITPFRRPGLESQRSVGPQNYFAPFTDYGFRDIALFLRRGIRKQRFWGHMSAADIKARVDPSIYDSYFKFCVVRNPWDRMISMFYHRKHKQRNDWESFQQMLDDGGGHSLIARSEGLYMIDGKVAVDRVVRYENLDVELEEIFEHIGLPLARLPRVNAESRKDRRHFSEALSQTEQARIAEMFADEIKRMGYNPMEL